MKHLKGFLIIITITLVGELLNLWLPLPIPASIYGFVILFLSLQFKIVKLKDVKSLSSFLLDIMPIMFVPAAVQIITSWDLLAPNILIILLIIALSTILVALSTGFVAQLLTANRGEKK